MNSSHTWGYRLHFCCCRGFKIYSQIPWHSSHQEVGINFPPFECGSNSVTDRQQTECGVSDGPWLPSAGHENIAASILLFLLYHLLRWKPAATSWGDSKVSWRDSCGRNWGPLSMAGKELRPPAESHVTELRHTSCSPSQALGFTCPILQLDSTSAEPEPLSWSIRIHYLSLAVRKFQREATAFKTVVIVSKISL